MRRADFSASVARGSFWAAIYDGGEGLLVAGGGFGEAAAQGVGLGCDAGRFGVLRGELCRTEGHACDHCQERDAEGADDAGGAPTARGRVG